jgi:hypothetical protein
LSIVSSAGSGVRTSTVLRISSQWPNTFSNAGIHVSRLAKLCDQRLRRFFRFSLAEKKHNLASRLRRQFDLHLNRRAWIETGAVAA